MGRPTKIKLEYFSMDVDMLQDIKIRKLLKNKGGARALGVYTHLLCLTYKNGYYLDYEEDIVFIIAEDLHDEENYVKDIVEYCLEVGLFDKNMYTDFGVLTSHGIQERYMKIQTRLKHRSYIKKYSLLTSEDTYEDVSSENTSVSTEETRVISEETKNKCQNLERNEEITVVSSGNSTQKKKEKKIERKNKLIPSSTSPAREERISSEISEGRNGAMEDIESEITFLSSDEEWKSSISSLSNCSVDEILTNLEIFKNSCKSRGIMQHLDINDAKRHFTDWLRKYLNDKISTLNSTAYGKTKQYSNQGSDRRRAAPVPAVERQKDYDADF